MIIELLVGILFLTLFNFANAIFDAGRILRHKKVFHIINATLYLFLIIALCIVFEFRIYVAVLFFIIAFLNRQITFDIPLNLLRHLEWYYQTKATGKEASLLDQLERKIFGNAEDVGKKIFRFYLIAYLAVIMLWIWT
jgi:hypothetical protein